MKFFPLCLIAGTILTIAFHFQPIVSSFALIGAGIVALIYLEVWQSETEV